jgi:hypothetical protein
MVVNSQHLFFCATKLSRVVLKCRRNSIMSSSVPPQSASFSSSVWGALLVFQPLEPSDQSDPDY